MKKVIVITSGGLDSTVLLYHHLKQGDEVRAIAIDYGQRHVREIAFAMGNAERLDIPYEIVNLHGLGEVLTGSSQTSKHILVPEGHYAEDNMKATVVPNRNMILLAVALGAAVANKFDGVSYAAHAGDHAIYPDCRPEFVDALNRAAALCDWRAVTIFRPFIKLTKAQIVRIGNELKVPFRSTYSCYAGRPVHCGKCGTCVERREAFHLAGVVDPTPYDKGAPPLKELLARAPISQN